MKYDPKQDMGEHHESDAGEESGHGSTGKPIKGDTDLDKGGEYDDKGNPKEGGGHYMKGGKLYKMGPMHKSVDAEELQKSLNKLEEFASDDAPTRKQELLSKAMEGSLDGEENAELITLMGGEQPMKKSEPTPAENITKSLENDTLQKAVDVSDYLKEHHDALEKSLAMVGEEIQKSDNRRHEFSIILAKAVRDIGSLAKSTHDIVVQLAGQPVGGPKSAGVQGGTRVLNKSMGGEPPQEEQLQKSQVLDALEDMGKSRDQIGNERIDIALSKYETSNMISKKMLGAVQQHIAGTQAAH